MESEDFRKKFDAIEEYLKRKSKDKKTDRFKDLLKEVCQYDEKIEKYSFELNSFSKLRNILKHTEHKPIAEPTSYSIKLINKIYDYILNPPSIELILKDKGPPFILKPVDPIYSALQIICEKDYSQIPIYKENKFINLLTTNTISRWLSSSLNINKIDFKNTKIGDVLAFDEVVDNHYFFKKSSSAYSVIEEFSNWVSEGKKLEAILITANGKPDEKLLNILTIWDLPMINSKLNKMV